MAGERKALGRIADALGVPVSDFHENGADRGSGSSVAKMEAANLLSHVRDHLRRSDPEDRRTFIAALLAIAGEDARDG